ncbi:alpha/beta fold hydrolase [Phaeovibrio sulfidiphilus]|uniref:Alpha/beta fold hydrolase n=1 Tax=Phaeovibrio sulfidiphilus TaxID=1220600 RepID=A0A8J6YL90_9PROT|nr:alpha/beta fold hydrolase [Phaeovibrio sulfidiphilus]
MLPGAEIRVHDLHEGPHPDHLSGAPVSDETAARVAPGAWLVGWSQGGQAAAHLAARRGAACPGLVTLGSNPRFTASTDWTAAMPVDTFNAFCEGFRTNPDLTLSRFHALCTKGGPGGRALARSLGETRPDRAACQARLALLGTQDARQDLVAYRGPQLHLYGSADALVPASVARDLAVLVPEATVEMIDGGSHAFALEDPAAVARRVAAFIREHTAP